MKIIAAIAICFSLSMAGCSTVAIPGGESHSPPAARVHSQDDLNPSSKRTASIFVARDKGMFGSGCSFIISLDGRRVVSLRQSEAVSLYVTAGTHFIKAESTGGICGSASVSQTLTISDGDRQEFRLMVSTNGAPSLTRER